jgi:hypothetical protein
MTPTQKTATVFPYVVAVVLLILSAALLVVASIPFSTLKPQLEALTLYGHAAVFTESFHARLVGILRFASAVPLVTAVTVFFFRRRITQVAGYAMTSLSTFFADSAKQAVDVLRKESRLHLALLASILVLAFFIRLLFLFQPMRYDEAYTFTHYASMPLYLGLSNYSAPNNHLLHTLLVHCSYLIFGNYPWALRLPALIAGWLLVPATYVVARVFFQRHAALLSAALVASSSPLVEFSTNARGYTLMALFFLLILSLAPYCLRSSNPAPWILFSVLSALGFYTLPTMLYAFGVVAGWLLMMALRNNMGAERLAIVRRLAISSAAAAALTLLLYGPVLLVWGPNALVANKFVAPESWERVLSALPASAASTWQLWNVAMPTVVSLVVAMGFAVTLALHARVSRYPVSPAIVGILWIVPVLLAQRVVPYERVWLFLLPLYLVLASAGLVFVWDRVAPTMVRDRTEVVGIMGLVLGLALAWNVAATQSPYYSNDTGVLRDGESITTWMKGHLKTGDVVMAVVPADAPLEYYFPVYNLRPADYWYSTQLHGPELEPGRRVLAVVRDAGPGLDAMLKTAGLTTGSLSNPELVERFQEAGIYEMVALGLQR